MSQYRTSRLSQWQRGNDVQACRDGQHSYLVAVDGHFLMVVRLLR